jgi:hypothetical protein
MLGTLLDEAESEAEVVRRRAAQRRAWLDRRVDSSRVSEPFPETVQLPGLSVPLSRRAGDGIGEGE